jgi:hypothetical protein
MHIIFPLIYGLLLAVLALGSAGLLTPLVAWLAR